MTSVLNNIAPSGLLKSSEVRALIRLMEDPDPFVQTSVNKRLSCLSESHVPVLDELREQTAEPELRQRISELIRQLTLNSLEHEFVEYLDQGVSTLADLERGQLLLCRLDNPTLRVELYHRQLNRMAERLQPVLKAGRGPDEQLKIFVSFFFQKEMYKGAESDYMNPNHSYIHKVLQHRSGIPISLSMIMLFVADRVELPLQGINMPLHFLLTYDDGREDRYLDAFNRGRVVERDQCLEFLRNSGIRPKKSHFDVATPLDMLARSIRNLINSYKSRQDSKRSGELKRFLKYTESYMSSNRS